MKLNYKDLKIQSFEKKNTIMKKSYKNYNYKKEEKNTL